MGKPFPIVEGNTPFRQLGRYIDKQIPAVLTKDAAGNWQILTQYDIIQVM